MGEVKMVQGSVLSLAAALGVTDIVPNVLAFTVKLLFGSNKLKLVPRLVTVNLSALVKSIVALSACEILNTVGLLNDKVAQLVPPKTRFPTPSDPD